MEIDIKIRGVGELRELVRTLKHLLRCHPHRRGRVNFVVGDTLEEVEEMSIANIGIMQGQTRYLSAVFSDASGTVHPLASLPTAADASVVLTLTAVGAGGAAPTPADPKFFWKVDCPATATAGATGTIHVSGSNADGTTDATDIPYTVNAADDTVVDVEVQDVAP